MSKDHESSASKEAVANTLTDASDIDNIICLTESINGYQVYSLQSLESSSPELKQDGPPYALRTTAQASVAQPSLDRYLLRSLPSHLSHEYKIHVIISSLSGTGQVITVFDHALKPVFDAVGLDESRYEVTRTSNAESVSEFATTILLPNAERGFKQTVIMLSGDGGVVDTLNGLLGTEAEASGIFCRPILCLLPLGTANALFHSLHRLTPESNPVVQSLRTLLHGKACPLPTFRATFSPDARLLTDEGRLALPIPNSTLHGAVVASYGLHSTLVADSDTPSYRAHGAKRFGMVANDLLFPTSPSGEKGMPHAYRARLKLFKSNGREEVVERRQHGYILITLVSNLEQKFLISPASQPLDGKLRILHFGVLSGEVAMGIMTKAYGKGQHIESKELVYDEVDGMRIEFEEEQEDWKWRRCCVDGLIVGVEKGGWMEVRKGDGRAALDVVVDREAIRS